jgi:anti-anti-sigma factor
MDVSIREESGCSVAAVKDRLDTMTVWEFEQKMAGLLEAGARKIVLDLSGLEYISSAGLRSLLAFSKKVKAAGGGMALCGLTGLPREIFAVSGFDTVFPLHATVEDAAESL